MSTTFNSTEELLTWIENISIENVPDEPVGLSERFPSTIELHIDGDQFDGTITTTVMESIVELQGVVYDAYKAATGTSRITQNDKRQLEFVVKVDKGTALVNIDLSGALEVLRTMQSVHIAIAVGLVVGGWTTITWIKEHYRSKREELKADTDKVTSAHHAESINRAIEALETAAVGTRHAYRRLSHAETKSIGINGKKVTSSEIAEATRAQRTKLETYERVVDGAFKVNTLDFTDSDETYMGAVHLETGTTFKAIALQQSILEEDDFQILQDSVEREPVEMRLIVSYKDGKVQGAKFDSLRRSQDSFNN